MGKLKTPGVYIVEKSAFPNSVVEVATAVPAFVGYTEQANDKGRSLLNRPRRISSMAEFHELFGGPPTKAQVRFSLTRLPGAAPAPDRVPLAVRDAVPLLVQGQAYAIRQVRGFYLLHYAMRQFFENGGGPCYVVSVGSYSDDAGIQVEADRLAAGIDTLAQELEPTIVVVPEAVLLDKSGSDGLHVAMLTHCGQVMRNRVAILDVWEGYRPRSADPDCVAGFRDGVGTDNLAYGAAYYPWFNTTIVQESDLGYENVDPEDGSRGTLVMCIKSELSAVVVDGAKLAQLSAEVDRITTAVEEEERVLLNKSLRAMSPLFKAILGEMARRLNLLPPSAALAGIYTLVDNTRGVWKAPANVGLNGVVSPAVEITHEEQEDLNVTPQGKSINAIRSFIGEGTLVWGARTLDGNSLDWRYINVRRTMIMLEESMRLAARALVNEPNVANTWLTLKGMIANFLTGIWKRGGLAGAAPEDAFSVSVGLGETMTPEDIVQGVLRVTVRVAISRPAEFSEITFQQQMQQP